MRDAGETSIVKGYDEACYMCVCVYVGRKETSRVLSRARVYSE